VKQSGAVLILILLLAVLIASCKSGGSDVESKKQRAREAVEALETSCGKPEGHGGRVALFEQQRRAREEVDALDYEVQPAYRRRLNEAWEGCAYDNAYQIVRKTLEPNGHPLTEQEIHHLSHQEAIRVEAAYEILKETKDRKQLENEYPYPDD
jgi:hypothetical protein